MKDELRAEQLEGALAALGEILAAEGNRFANGLSVSRPA